MKSFSSFFLVSIMACNGSEKTGNITYTDTIFNDTNTAPTPMSLDGCYTWALNKDTALLSIKMAGSGITGTLIYDWNEKDRNAGTLKGIVQDSLVIAQYTFESEGMQSVREVAFKIQRGELVEGFGNYTPTGDTLRFSDITKLKYQSNRPFKKVDCDEQKTLQ
jgi:hypothetical protein